MLGLGNLLTKSGVIKKFPNDFSFNFDGNGDYLDCGASNVLVTGTNVTLSCWFKVDGTSRGYLIQNQKGAGSTNLTIQVNSNDSSETAGYVGAIIWSGAGHDFISVDGSVDDGAWHHLALTTTSSAQVLYLDGTSVATGSGTFINASSTDSTLIGNDGGSNYDFDGLIDEVAIWDVALDSSDITSVYNNGKIIDLSKSASYGTDRTANLKLWLRCGDKVEPETSIARSDFYTDFDGSNDRVVFGTSMASGLGDSYSANQGLSVTCWFKNDGTTDGGLFQIGNNGGAGEFSFQKDNNNDLYFLLNGNGWHRKVSFTDTSSWHHVACIYGSSEANSKIYLDGEAVGTAGGSFPSTLDFNGLHTTIGDYWNLAYSWLGKISNVSVYQTALDAQTIKQFAKSRYTPMRDNRFSVVSLDGTNDFIDCGNDSSLQFSGSFSIGCWFRTTDSSSTNEILISKADDGVSAGWLIRLNSSRKLDFSYVNYASGGVGVTISDTGSVVNDGQWYHVMFVHESGVGNRAYKNGVLVGSNSTGTDLGSHTPNFHIGNQDYSSARALACDVSSASAYNTAKSAEEVYALYSKGITYNESSESGLVGLWRMGSDTSKAYPTIADSSSNSNDGTITNGASDDIVQQMVAGYDMGAFESSSEELGGELISNSTFDDSTDWTAVGDFTISNGVASITNASQYSQLTAYSSNFLYSGKTYKLQLDVTTLSKTAFAYRVSGGAVTYITSSALVDNTFTTYFTMTQNGYLWFQTTGSYTGLNVVIDNVSVKEVLQSDLSDTYPAIIDVNEPVLGAELVTSNTTSNWTALGSGTSKANITNGVTLTAGSDARNHYYEVSGTSSGKIYKFNVDAFMDDASDTNASINVWDGNSSNLLALTTTTQNFTFYFIHEGTPFIQFANFDNGTTANFQNMSIKEVLGNVGTMTQMDGVSNLVYSSVLPDQSFLATGVNSAYNFIDLDGSDQYIDCGDGTSLDITSEITLSAWVNSDVIDIHSFIAGRDDGTNRNYYLELYTDEKFYWTCNGLSDTQVVSTTTFSAGSWYHVVGVYDGSNIKLYINGFEEDSDSSTGSIDNDDVSFTIGAREAGADRFINGKMGQVSLWNKALSATEVGAIYTLGRHGNLLDKYSDNLVGYWGMSALDASTGLSDSISTIYDRSGNSNHGTPQNADAGDLASSPNAEPNGYAKGDTNRSTTTP